MDAIGWHKEGGDKHDTTAVGEGKTNQTMVEPAEGKKKSSKICPSARTCTNASDRKNQRSGIGIRPKPKKKKGKETGRSSVDWTSRGGPLFHTATKRREDVFF